MGAWGVDPFDNDDAADWAGELDGVDAEAGIAVLREALSVSPAGYLEAYDGSIAVAAAQVVAWIADPASINDSPYSEAAAAWVRASALVPSGDLVDLARMALTRVGSPDSELSELWGESGDGDWRAALDEISRALQGGDGPTP